MRRRYVSAMTAVAALVSSCAGPARRGTAVWNEAARFDAQGRPNVGTLEFRGRRYDLRDLMDPGIRERSGDRFMRTFEPDRIYAGL